MKDYYKILGVSENVTPEELKSAYKKLVKEHHPDKGGDVQKMQEINEAHDTLKDTKKREEYDTIRKYGQNPYQSHHQHYDPFGQNGHEHDLNDILRDIMGRQFGSRGFGPNFGHGFNQRQPVNRDINLEYHITLEDAFKGKKVKANIQLEKGTKEIVFDIPAGVNHGDRIRIRNQGYNEHPNIKPGDVFIHIAIKSNAVFERKGQHLYSNLHVDALDAMLGTTALFNAIDGSTISVKVPAGTQQNDVLRCRGKGFKVRDIDAYGDLFLKVNITIPKSLTPEEESLIRQVKMLRKTC